VNWFDFDDRVVEVRVRSDILGSYCCRGRHTHRCLGIKVSYHIVFLTRGQCVCFVVSFLGF